MKKLLKVFFKLSIYFLIVVFAFIGFRSVFGSDKNNNVVVSGDKIKCIRTEPYVLDSALERARSLRKQRLGQAGFAIGNEWNNCINIVYKQIPDNAEGMFYFDKNSSTQNLTIYVDDRYKNSDDLLTSVLLSHEFAHVGQFINQITTGKETPCFESEIQAFKTQLTYLMTLNEEEMNSLNQKVYFLLHNGYDDKSMISSVSIIKDLIDMYNSNSIYCDSKVGESDMKIWGDCVLNNTDQQLINYVKSNSIYQQQCATQN